MLLTNKQINILFRCVGSGPLNKAKIVIFGNEFGTAEGNGSTEVTVKRLIERWTTYPVFPVGPGFVTTYVEELPVSSVFLQCISRMMLAIRYKDERFFGPLSGEGRAFLNKYILEELYRTDIAVINLKPLPQKTERHWDYDNIDEKRYNNMFNFTLSNSLNSPLKQLRIQILKEAFKITQNSLILGAGDKHNKKAFFEFIIPEIIFETVELSDNIKIYVSKDPRIILSNYYSPYTGLGLNGMKILYSYIEKNNLI